MISDEKDEEKVKKESIDQVIDSLDVSDDVAALTDGEELSEEFKEKASTIFEAAVNNEVDKQLALAEAEVHAVFDTAIDDAKTELTEQLDNYFDYVTDQWFEDNQVAIDTGIRSEIAENFISGLKTLSLRTMSKFPKVKLMFCKNSVNNWLN